MRIKFLTRLVLLLISCLAFEGCSNLNHVQDACAGEVGSKVIIRGNKDPEILVLSDICESFRNVTILISPYNHYLESRIKRFRVKISSPIVFRKSVVEADSANWKGTVSLRINVDSLTINAATISVFLARGENHEDGYEYLLKRIGVTWVISTKRELQYID